MMARPDAAKLHLENDPTEIPKITLVKLYVRSIMYVRY
jgi:hypothetical protein